MKTKALLLAALLLSKPAMAGFFDEIPVDGGRSIKVGSPVLTLLENYGPPLLKVMDTTCVQRNSMNKCTGYVEMEHWQYKIRNRIWDVWHSNMTIRKISSRR